MNIIHTFEFSFLDREFLVALFSKKYFKNQWSKSPLDDKFCEYWQKQIQNFISAGLVEESRDISTDVVIFRLNNRGVLLRNRILTAGLLISKKTTVSIQVS